VHYDDTIEAIAFLPKGVKVVIDDTKAINALVLFNGSNGLDVTVSSQDGENYPTIEQEIKRTAYVPPNTEITPRAKAHLIQAVVEAAT